MKKLLSLIGAISIVGSGASAVIACDDNSNTVSPDQKTANAIAAKVKNKNLVLPAVTTNLDTSNKDTQQALKTVLYEDNKGAKGLTQQEVNQYFSFSKTTLDVAKAVAVTATITVKEAKATVSLMVSIPNGATYIAKQIKKRNLAIPYKSGTSQWRLTDSDFLAFLKTNLLEQNPDLKVYSASDFALKDIQVKGKPSQKTIAVNVEAALRVTIDSQNDNTSTVVDMFVYPYGAASAIASKISNTDTVVLFNSQKVDDYNTSNSAFDTAILQQIQSDNKLNTAEINALSISKNSQNISIPPGSSKQVTITISVPTAAGLQNTAEKNVTVTAQYPDIADRVIGVINSTIGLNGSVVLPTGIANPDLTNQDVKDAMFNAIKYATRDTLPQGLVESSMSYVLVSGGTLLQTNQSNAVQVTYTSSFPGDLGTATTTLNVYPPSDRAHQVIAMFKYLSNVFWNNDLGGYFGGLLANWNSDRSATRDDNILTMTANAAFFMNSLVDSSMQINSNELKQLKISAAAGSSSTLAVAQNIAEDTNAINVVVKYGDTSNAPEVTIKALMLSPAASFYISYANAVYILEQTSTPKTNVWNLAAGTNPLITSNGFAQVFNDKVVITAINGGYPFYYFAYYARVNFAFSSDDLPNNTLTPGQTAQISINATNRDGSDIGISSIAINQFKYANVNILTV